MMYLHNTVKDDLNFCHESINSKNRVFTCNVILTDPSLCTTKRSSLEASSQSQLAPSYTHNSDYYSNNEVVQHNQHPVRILLVTPSVDKLK